VDSSVNKEELRENKRYFGWIMLASILTDEWNIFLIPQTNLFVENIYRLSSLELGIITGIVILGAAIGSFLGGIFTDFLGRKKVFQIDMGLSIFSGNFLHTKL
jgi:Sugar (and other) transporter.